MVCCIIRGSVVKLAYYGKVIPEYYGVRYVSLLEPEGCRPTNGVIEVVVESEDDHVIVNVRDHGAGIEQKNLSKLFKKFQQLGHPTGQKVKGTGLGLAIAKALVEMHGGKIFVENDHRLGTF